MTVSSTVAKSGPYTGADDFVFAYNFRVFADAEILVTTVVIATGVEEALTLTTDYTVQDAGDPTGTITLTAGTFPTGLPSTKKLVVSRDMGFLQEIDFENQGGFFPDTHEDGLDRLKMEVQQVKEEVDRSVKVDITGTTTPDDLLDDITDSVAAASASAAAAETAETNAETAETNAETAEAKAEDWAEEAEDVEVETGQYSALHWAAKAAAEDAYSKTESDATFAPITRSRKNLIINGGFDVWQRGTTQTAAANYGSDDRWSNSFDTTTRVHTRQAFSLGQTDVPGEPRFYSRTVVTSVAGAGSFSAKYQRVEDVRRTAGKTVTLSFWAKADATKDIAIEFYQSFGTGGSPSSDVNGIDAQKVSLTTSWQKFEVTGTFPSVSGKTMGTNENSWASVLFWFDAGSTYNSRTDTLGQQDGTFEIARVQLERGDVATDFEQRSFGEELALCQRYYCKSYDVDVDPGTTTDAGAASVYSASNYVAFVDVGFPVFMRAGPTITTYSNITGTAGKIRISGADYNSTLAYVGSRGMTMWATGTVVQAAASVHYTADAEL